MSKLKVYVTDYEYASLQEEINEIEKIGAELIPCQCKTEDDVIVACADAAGLLDQYAPITRRVIESLPNLKVVARYGVGVNTVDLEAATEHGVCVVNVPDYCVDEVSDQAFALLMACARKITLLNDQVKGKGWDYKISKPINRLRGQKLGLLGFGRIPRALAEKAKAFGLELLVYDPFVKAESVEPYGAKLLSLDEVLQAADFISVHVPLTDDTHHLLGEREFAMMKSNAIVINTSRGQLIDEVAMIKALAEKRIAGAGLDVLEDEPTAVDNPLLNMEQVVITPHVAWYSEQSEGELKTKVARGAADVLAGFYPASLVNRQVAEKLSLKKR